MAGCQYRLLEAFCRMMSTYRAAYDLAGKKANTKIILVRALAVSRVIG
jgi:hypothetical protein